MTISLSLALQQMVVSKNNLIAKTIGQSVLDALTSSGGVPCMQGH